MRRYPHTSSTSRGSAGSSSLHYTIINTLYDIWTRPGQNGLLTRVHASIIILALEYSGQFHETSAQHGLRWQLKAMNSTDVSIRCKGAKMHEQKVI